MAMTHRSDLVDEIEKALRDEAYDGGFGYMGDQQFTAYVRTLAVTAAKVVEEAHTPTDDEREALAEVIEVLDTHGQWPVDQITEAVLVAGFRRTEVPEPSTARGKSGGKYTDTQVLYMVLLALEEGLEGVRWQDLDDLLVKMIAEHWGTADEDTSPDEAEAAFAQLEPHIPDHMRTSEPQGEPAGARVRAVALAIRNGMYLDEARVEVLAEDEGEFFDQVALAALRAAGEVTR